MKGITKRHGHHALGKRLKWLEMMVLLMALLLASAAPGEARVFIEPSIVVPFGPFWAPYWTPYWAPYGYPPVVVAPSPPIYVQPPPSPSYWYYCDNPKGYYPYVQHCPGGWRPVAPTPP
jgi:hypothetical protein